MSVIGTSLIIHTVSPISVVLSQTLHLYLESVISVEWADSNVWTQARKFQSETFVIPVSYKSGLRKP